jgi:hypothetical protein
MMLIGSDISTLKAQVRNSSILLYYQQNFGSNLYSRTLQNIGNNKTYKGEVTSHTKKRIERAVNIFLQISPVGILNNPITKTQHPFQLSFITLTVTENKKVVSHQESYTKLLKPFLTWLRDTKLIKTYIWKAEVQKRGQIHYHITLNEFIHYQEVREKWNYLQQKAGYLVAFAKQYNHYQPNSTDIHSVVKIRNIEAYLCKYMSKHLSTLTTNCYLKEKEYEESKNGTRNDKYSIYNHDSKEQPLISEIIEGNILSNEPANYFDKYTVEGKVWDCSINIKGKKYYTLAIDDNNLKRLTQHLANNDYREFRNDYCIIVNSDPTLKTNIMLKDQKEHYDIYMESLKRKEQTVSKKKGRFLGESTTE